MEIIMISEAGHKSQCKGEILIMLRIIALVLLFIFALLFSNASGEERTLCVAHRGGSAYAPENTVAAFENAVKMGVDYIELDVHLTKDGYPVVIHDDSLERTTDGTGKVKDKTLDELKELDAGSWFSDEFKGEKLPTLEEAMDFVKGRAGLFIEIKSGNDLCDGIEEKIVELIREKDMVREVIVISFNYDRIKNINELDPEIATGFLYGGNVPDVCEMALNAGVDYISPSWQAVTEDIIKEAHSNNIGVSLWTINEPDIMKKFIDLGVDAITTDKPDLLLKELER